MKNILKIGLIFVELLTLQQAKAGHEVGNGGDVVVCPAAGGAKTAILLDYHESVTKRNLTVDFGISSGNYEDYLERAFSRIERLNPTRAATYREWYKSFWKEAALLPGITLVDIPDTGSAAIPIGCALEQAAVQAPVQFPGDKLYTISKDIWDVMDPANKAGLILHELILRDALRPVNGPQENSVRARFYHARLADPSFEKLDLKSYTELLTLVQFVEFDAGPWKGSLFRRNKSYEDESEEFKLTPPTFYPSGLVKTIYFDNSEAYENSKVQGFVPVSIPPSFFEYLGLHIGQPLKGSIINDQGFLTFNENGLPSEGVSGQLILEKVLTNVAVEAWISPVGIHIKGTLVELPKTFRCSRYPMESHLGLDSVQIRNLELMQISGGYRNPMLVSGKANEVSIEGEVLTVSTAEVTLNLPHLEGPNLVAPLKGDVYYDRAKRSLGINLQEPTAFTITLLGNEAPTNVIAISRLNVISSENHYEHEISFQSEKRYPFEYGYNRRSFLISGNITLRTYSYLASTYEVKKANLGESVKLVNCQSKKNKKYEAGTYLEFTDGGCVNELSSPNGVFVNLP